MSAKPNDVLRLVSWNVNGIRAILGKGFHDFVASHQPDILLLQEVKARPEQVSLALPDYHAYWNPASKAGYSGVATLSKQAPLSVQLGIGTDAHDQEGRVLTLEYPKVYVVNVYTPNAQDELRRLAYRTQEWDVAFLAHVNTLAKNKPVIFGGDLNVAHKEIDLANPKTNVKNAGFTPEERAGFDNILAAGFIDSFRHFDPNPGRYSWWSYRAGARGRNVGWRIDYFCVSASLQNTMKAAYIWPEIMGSDHCPVGLDLDPFLLVP